MPRLAGFLRLSVRRPAAGRPPGPSRGQRARAAVLATAAGVVATAAVTTGLVERYRLDAVDVEYAGRRTRLAARQAESPDRPLFVVAGSSRLVLGFAPELLPPLPAADGGPPLVFNLSHYGAGPIMTRVTLGRAVASGVRPRWVVLELMPPFVARENARLVSSMCTAGDVAAAGRFYPNGELYVEYLRNRAYGLPGLVRRATLAPEPGFALNPLGGYAALIDDVTPAERERATAVQVPHFARLLKDWKPDPGADRAFRETVALCRAAGATVRLLLTPEGPEHRKLYGPGGRERVTAYAETLSRELDLPVTDARDWLAETDFADSHHPLRRGAEKFTSRLARDVIGPMVAAGP